MTKLILSDVDNLQNEGSAILTLHNNNVATVAAVENTISRDGTAPNQMAAALDMNSNKIINTGTPTVSGDAVSLSYLGNNAVLYSSAQTLTVAQKAQARDNIGATAGAGAGGGGTGVTSFNGRTGVVAATAGDYTATQITNTPAGQIAAVTVQAALNELDTEKVAANSPALTGVPTAPTAAPSNNTTQIATTAYADAGDAVLNAAKAPLASPTFTGNPLAPTPSPGDNDTSIATTAFVTTALAATAASPSMPQGRLTLVSATPVMSTTQITKTTVYYTPYFGNLVPIYNGTSMVMTSIGSEISVSTTDTTKSPAAIGPSKINDWYVWNDAGTVRIGHGPDWTNDTTRATGLTMVNGILLNTAAITNGPAASRGTYVGTTRSVADNTLYWQYGITAANGGQGFFSLWNTYNRRQFVSFTADSTDTWTYAVSGVWRAANASASMRCSFVFGLQEDSVQATYSGIGIAGAGTTQVTGVGLDTTTNFSGTTGNSNQTVVSSIPAGYVGMPPIGFHFVSANEFNNSATSSSWFGDAGVAYLQSGLMTSFYA